jgi:hypothetical protein
MFYFSFPTVSNLYKIAKEGILKERPQRQIRNGWMFEWIVPVYGR